MSEVWPFDLRKNYLTAPRDDIGPFKCLLLMPFQRRFDNVAAIVHDTVNTVNQRFRMPLPQINRLDWVTSTNVIQGEIWREVLDADLIFCDISGANPNVMIELGVCAAWKQNRQVVLIKDIHSPTRPVFDISPIRYTEYDLTWPAVDHFRKRLDALVEHALISFPDTLGDEPPGVALPLEIDFSTGRDDPRMYTPPFAHRRMKDGALEFGSLFSYADSWASIGRLTIGFFRLAFSARFSNPQAPAPKIGLAFRSHHYYANYGHNISLAGDGSIWITKPNDGPPPSYDDEMLRSPTPILPNALHHFTVTVTPEEYTLDLDGFAYSTQISEMAKLFPPGLIRFHSARSWMAVTALKLEAIDPDP